MEEAKGTGDAKPETQAELIERMVAEHRAQEETEAAQEVNPFDLINKGVVKITSDAEANAIGKLLLGADRQLADAEAIEAKRVARAKARAARLHGIFDQALQGYAKDRLNGKKARNLLLENVNLCLRKRAAHYETSGDADLLAWAERDFVDAITYKPVLSMTRVQEWEKVNGRPAPGRVEIEAQEKLSIKIPDPKEEDSDGNKA